MCILIIRDNLQNWPSARQTNLMVRTLSVQIFIMPSNLDISVVHFLFVIRSYPLAKKLESLNQDLPLIASHIMFLHAIMQADYAQ